MTVLSSRGFNAMDLMPNVCTCDFNTKILWSIIEMLSDAKFWWTVCFILIFYFCFWFFFLMWRLRARQHMFVVAKIIEKWRKNTEASKCSISVPLLASVFRTVHIFYTCFHSDWTHSIKIQLHQVHNFHLTFQFQDLRYRIIMISLELAWVLVLSLVKLRHLHSSYF